LGISMEDSPSSLWKKGHFAAFQKTKFLRFFHES
jgi:hypothetical protein